MEVLPSVEHRIGHNHRYQYILEAPTISFSADLGSQAVTGLAHRTASGQLSLMAVQLPRLLAPCLHHFPVDEYVSRSGDPEDGQSLDRHVELLTNKDAVATLVLRSEIIQKMRDFLRSEGFIEVDTPILAGSAGGASARPFETTATEFTNRKLSLRIAPELWLKRLIIGGMERVFEIGPCFRNEGMPAWRPGSCRTDVSPQVLTGSTTLNSRLVNSTPPTPLSCNYEICPNAFSDPLPPTYPSWARLVLTRVIMLPPLLDFSQILRTSPFRRSTSFLL
jgi:hypothetical protein